MTNQKSGLKFKLVVEEDGKEVHSEELSHFMLRTLEGNWLSGEFSPELLGYFAQHPDDDVALKAARADHISDETLEHLAKSENLAIRMILVGNEKFRDWASAELLIKYACADVETASRIASSLDSFKSADRSAVAQFLLEHSNPHLRYCIVDDFRFPQKTLKSIHAKDPDLSVRHAAKRKMEER